ncbi:hypothetical protein chiPu_0000862 [Chiloscyllium punctatum]|uniref:VWFD domain-containing protein n=1 Tax=Chiloscyllium punctatum TaxID=137246 RepID=A0A401RWE5_CHIPU|nr:hypothetical protein [Chiloscyllium punctatum]
MTIVRKIKLMKPWSVLVFSSLLQLFQGFYCESSARGQNQFKKNRFNTILQKRNLLAIEGYSTAIDEHRSLIYNSTHRYAEGVCSQDCLNGGFCNGDNTCDCNERQANSSRCQTVPNLGKDRGGICRSWGQYHFETFDGLYFYFPGKCSYILAKDCRATQPQYMVEVHNSDECASSHYSCSRSISLFFPNEEEITILGHSVSKGGIRLPLPQTVRHAFFERLADYILVKTTFGFSLAWDGFSGVYMKLTEEHKGKPCGLCGNFNGDMSDDLNTSYSMLTEDVAIFGNSWMSQTPSDAPCASVLLDFHSPCRGKGAMINDIIAKCEVLMGFPFFTCREYVQPNPYIASCINDLCMMDDSETHCRAITEYARACSHAGYPLMDWRDDFPTCTDQCEDSFVHRDCISCCPPTCTFEKECLGSSLHCLDGCYCPDGLVMENGTCISVSTCPCIYHGTVYPIGSHLQEGCNMWKTSHFPKMCNRYSFFLAECSVTGDMHFTTFDGRIFTFLGTCQYIFAKSHRSNKFTVTLQNVPCGQNLDHSCIQSITLIIEGDTSNQITLTRSGEIHFGNQQAISLPYQNGIFEMRRLSSIFLQVKTNFGLSMQFDKEGGRLYLQLDNHWRGNTVGLCGTYNGNLRDDFLSPVGMIEGTPQLHANAWKISSACVTPINIPLVDPCDTNQQNALYSSTMCDILNQELFAPCHSFVNPSPYYQQCRYDACKCGSLCMCTALAHYAYLCAKHKVHIDFRSEASDCGIICPANMLYHICSSSCGRTCQSLSVNEVCGDDCAEGCNCPSGTFYDEILRRCVMQSQCSCYFMGGIFQAGEVTYSNSGPCWKGQEYLPGEVVSTECYTCVCLRGVFNCTYHPCPAVCTIYSDRHYRSFDGLEYDYVSDCQVYLVKSTANLNVSITTQNVDCYDSGIICMKSLMISVGGTHLYFNDNSGKPSLSGVRRAVPDFQFWKAGYYSVVHYPVQEITVFWDRKTTVHIQAGPQWQGKMTGLCGNFDQNTANDMTTSNNMEVSNAQAFGDSWALGQCVSRNGITRPCEADLIRQPFAKRECAILYSDVFAPCHNVVDVTWFYKNCLTDTCNCNRAVDCEYYNRDLGEGPFMLINYLCNDTVIANNKITGDIVPLQINSAGQDVIMNFMITPGLYKAKQSKLPVVSLESAERPNYFIHVGEDDNLHLEQWEDNQRFHKDASFIHHRSNWIPGYSTFELYSRKGFFITLTPSAVKVVQYDYSESFKLSSSFKIEESSMVIRYRTMCEYRYEACANPCIKTCSDPHAIACKFLSPVEGCLVHCPKNMLLDEATHRCVYLEDCINVTATDLPYILPTTTKPVTTEKVYSSLTTVVSPTVGQKTTAISDQYATPSVTPPQCICPFNITQPSCGFLGMPIQINKDRCCPQWECPCRCSMFSDLHIITFDGNDVGVYDAAAYVLTLLPDETIVGHIEQCPTREVPGGNSGLCFKKLNITSRNYKVLIDRLERLTTVNTRPARLPFTKLGFHIQDTGAMYLITTPAGVTIQWYRSTGIIVLEFGLPSNRTVRTKGLCGCCNGNPADDLKLPNGTIVTEVENVTPEIFCELWIRDFHYVTHQCDALALYAAACNKYNVCIPWRTPEFCPLSCPVGMEYQPCVPACESKTCQNKDFYLEHDSTCSFVSESCVCPRGTLLHQPDSNYCVTEEQCACTDNEGQPRAADETWNGSHKGCCMYKCLGNGTIVAVEPECVEVPSPMCEREGEIIIDVIEEGACCPKKICECNLTICGTDVLTCENGDKLVIGYSAISCCPEYRCECDPLACPTSSPPVCREDQFLVEVRKDDSCCFSFQCVCESCIDPIPICNEGDVLAVDLNTTDRCCPSYHCICDENLCSPPDKICTDGTKLVKKPVSGICCPDWQCACNCESSNIVSCQVGEVLTEDHDFQNICGCTRFICKKADVCVFQRVTALKPGQSLVQRLEDDQCYIANCLQNTDPVAESPLLQVSLVSCSAKCESNQVYVPSSDPHVCCGTCKNMSCTFEEDGSIALYNTGTSWVTNCVRYKCLETAAGLVVLGSGVICPPFNETECIQKGGVTKPYMDGCCKTCKEDTRPCRKGARRQKCAASVILPNMFLE